MNPAVKHVEAVNYDPSRRHISGNVYHQSLDFAILGSPQRTGRPRRYADNNM